MFLYFALLVLLLKVNGQMPLTFTGCGGKWHCQNSGDYAHLTFSCEKYEETKVDLERLVRQVKAVVSSTLASLTLSDCRALSLSMSLSQGQMLKNLTVWGVHNLEIRANREISPQISHPSDITFKDIDYIPVLPTGAISSPLVEDIVFERVNIGTIETNAITNDGGKISSVVWKDITVKKMSEKAIVLSMHSEGVFRMTSCRLPSMAPSTWLQQGGAISILRSSFEHLQPSSIIANVRRFYFSSNKMEETEKLDIISPEITFIDNSFGDVTSSFPFNWIHFMNGKDPSSDLKIIVRGNGIHSHIHMYEFESGNCTVEEDIKGGGIECSIRFRHFSGQGHECRIGEGVFVRAICGETCTTAQCDEDTATSCTGAYCKSVKDKSFQDDPLNNSSSRLSQPWVLSAIINYCLLSIVLAF